MPDVYLGRINRFIEKFLNVKGGPTLVDIDNRVAAHVGIPWSTELNYLSSIDTFGMAVAVPAAASNVGGVRLRNPVGSGVVATVFKCCAWLGATGQINLNISNTITVDLANANTGIKMDRRMIRTNSTMLISNQNTTPTITTGVIIAISNPLGNTEQVFIQQDTENIPLLPGDSLDVIANIANTLLLVGLQWRERALESSELT